jgi:hypothetical protein
MVFVYLRDGERRDIEEGVAFAHRGEWLICLNRDGEEVGRFKAHDVNAYGHVAYPYNVEFVSRPLDPEEAQPWPGHHRRRHRRRNVHS